MSSEYKGRDQDVPAIPLPDCGQRISVESQRHEAKLWTQMIGFKPGSYVVLEKPPGTDAIDGRQALKDGDSLVVRFLKDGSIYGFRTPVLGTTSVPYRLLFVGYPGEIVQHSLRSSPRLECYLPCDGDMAGRAFARAFIRDFSATGCQLRIPLDAIEPAAEADGSNAEGRLTVNVQLPGEDQTRAVRGDVLEQQTLPRFYQVRVKFDEPQKEIFEQLTVYTTRLG